MNGNPLVYLASLVVAALVVMSGAWFYHFDRDPHATPPINAHFLWWRVEWPVSPAAAGAQTVQSLKVCTGSLKDTTGALDRQNAAVQALASEGQRRTANATAAVQQAQHRAVGRNQEIAAIEGIKPQGPDLCSDALAVIHAVPQ